MTPDRKCPNCDLLNLPSALRCDCGYDFTSQTMQKSYLSNTQMNKDLTLTSIGNRSYALASLGERLLAQLLDKLFGFVPLLIGVWIMDASSGQGQVGFWFFVSGALVYLFYLLFQDGFGRGQSYGKRIVGIRVVDASSGDSCTLLQSFGRNVLLPVFGIIDCILIFGRMRRRLGDIMANTLVVKNQLGPA